MAIEAIVSEPLSPELYRAILEDLPTAVYLVDRERRILLWNRGAEEMTGYLGQEVIGRSCKDDLLMHCDENQACLCGTGCPLLLTMHDGHPRNAAVFLLHKDGRRVPVTVRAVPFRDDRGQIIGAVECFERRLILPTADPQLAQQRETASLDELTGLPDHAALLAGLSAHLSAYDRSPVPFGVLDIAVDALDRLRHSDGRIAVEEALYTTGQTLAGTMGPNDMIGRWSDERFLAVITGCTASTLIRAADRMKRLVHLSGIPWWGDRLSITISMGGTIVRPDDTPEALTRRAEEALAGVVAGQGDCVVVA